MTGGWISKGFDRTTHRLLLVVGVVVVKVWECSSRSGNVRRILGSVVTEVIRRCVSQAILWQKVHGSVRWWVVVVMMTMMLICSIIRRDSYFILEYVVALMRVPVCRSP